MKNLFDAATAEEIKQRAEKLKADSERQWGKMTAAQAVAHCAVALETALGEQTPPPMLLGRIIGGFVKPLALGNDEPMRRNSPTVKSFVVSDQRDLGTERQRLDALIDRFSTGGPAACTTFPHSFFGKLTPQEWAVLMYKHLDHHLRQFGV